MEIMDTILGSLLASIAVTIAFTVSMQIFAYYAWYAPLKARHKATSHPANGLAH